MNLGLDLLLAIVAQIFTAGAVYGAIRADIRAAHSTAAEAKTSALGAHKRIDHLLMKEH
jgi:hypothetical protein